MKTDDIISMYGKINADCDERLQLVRSFSDDRDMEIAAILCAWLSNGFSSETQAMFRLIYTVMEGNPYRYISEKHFNAIGSNGDYVVCGMLTSKHMKALMNKIYECYDCMGSIHEAVSIVFEERKKYEVKYGHEALAMILGGGTMFPTKKSNETFYRYNLISYLLSKSVPAWDLSISSHFLLPCNDEIFKKAHDVGIVSHRMKTSLSNTISLTKKAKKIFGEEHFNMMYELLKSGTI